MWRVFSSRTVRCATALLTLMCSNSRSVSTLTDWLMILSREELALTATSSLPCGSHCLQRSTKDLVNIQDTWNCSYHHSFLPLSPKSGRKFSWLMLPLLLLFVYLRGGQQLTRAMVLETYPSPLSPNSAWVSWNISTFLWKLNTLRLYENIFNTKACLHYKRHQDIW